jgi:hypothetical protein
MKKNLNRIRSSTADIQYEISKNKTNRGKKERINEKKVFLWIGNSG